MTQNVAPIVKSQISKNSLQKMQSLICGILVPRIFSLPVRQTYKPEVVASIAPDPMWIISGVAIAYPPTEKTEQARSTQTSTVRRAHRSRLQKAATVEREIV